MIKGSQLQPLVFHLVFGLLYLALTATGWTAETAPASLPPKKAENPLLLELTALNAPIRDFNKLKLQLKATNTGTNDLIVDKELVTNFSLRFATRTNGALGFSRDVDVENKEVSRLETPSTNAYKERFIALKPGKSIVREYDLARPLRIPNSGHMTVLEGRARIHHGFYYESMDQYIVPPAVEKLRVRVFHGGVWPMAAHEFKQWHGRTSEELGLSESNTESNALIVEKDK